MMSGISPPLVQNLDWYHPSADRHVSESLLMQNGREGSYLLRPSSRQGELALSVRGKDSVRHYEIKWTGSQFIFGHTQFSSMKDFVKHFENRPLLAGESGLLTMLRFPYPRKVCEFQMYDTVQVHGETGLTRINSEPPLLAIGTKEGFLTKLGGRVKVNCPHCPLFVQNWKTRWFTVAHNELKYFRDKNDTEPVRVLDMKDCSQCVADTSKGKENCFRKTNLFSRRMFI